MKITARIDNFLENKHFLLSDPIEIITANSLVEVPGAIQAVENSMKNGGNIALGYVSYEAAGAIDNDQITLESNISMPLLWFCIFKTQLQDTGPNLQPMKNQELDWKHEWDKSSYMAKVLGIQDLIREGFTYQVNLTSRLHSRFIGDPFELYSAMLSSQTGSHSFYIESDDWAVICASPELFFKAENGLIKCKPMKGTRSRGRYSLEDLSLRDELINSEKDRAENLMIVDLIRNDLGKVSEFGTVEVESAFDIEQYPTLWQMTSTVKGQLRANTDLLDIFKALFPCGSVTGVPKVSTMEIITRFEDSPRGIYCGAIGWIRYKNSQLCADFGVAIRCATLDKNTRTLSYGAGGGITSGSEPESEWEELLAKTSILTGRKVPDGLLETMYFSPQTGIKNLERHLKRMQASAKYFGFDFDLTTVRENLRETSSSVKNFSRLRLILRASSEVNIEYLDFDEIDRTQVTLALCPKRVNAENVFLFHKVADRSYYRDMRDRIKGVYDVILANERDEITETTTANLALKFEGKWWTPAISSGLLPGIEREVLLESGELDERVIKVDELSEAQEIAVMNSLRGFIPAKFISNPI